MTFKDGQKVRIKGLEQVYTVFSSAENGTDLRGGRGGFYTVPTELLEATVEPLNTGDRVRVTYEGTYGHKGAISGHYLEPQDPSGCRPFVPDGGVVEVIVPEVEEPKALGAVVEVKGRKVVRLDEDDAPWRVAGAKALDDGWYFTWGELEDLGEVTVLFSPELADRGEDA